MSVQTVAPHVDSRVIASQATFRAVMDAMARPGLVSQVAAAIDAPSPLTPATGALALSLFDHDTPLWLDAGMGSHDVVQWLRFHTSAPIAGASDQAAFALISDIAALPPLESFAFGTPDYPDRSTTLIVQVDALEQGPAWKLRGPGIDGSAVIRVDARLRDLLAALAINAQIFPRGVDLVLAASDAIVALPRTTRIEPMEA